jgi:hypothetical protein
VRNDAEPHDSNVIFDVAYEYWRAWSEAAIEQTAEQAALVINPIIYAEVSIGTPGSSMSRCARCGSLSEGSVAVRGPPFSLANRSWRTVGVAEREPRHCRLFKLEPMRPCAATGC